MVQRSVMELAGAPAFKTEKLLGGRVIMTDSWSRAQTSNAGNELISPTAWISNPVIGHGMGCGYNALYGDGSASWFGDPQQKIMYWPWTTTYPATGYTWNEPSICGRTNGNLAITYYCQGDRYYRGYSAMYMGGWANMAVWHLFDMAANMDVGAPLGTNAFATGAPL
jgi:hypothetical protein